MCAIFVVVRNVLGQQPFQVLFIEGNDVIQEIVAAAATQRSAIPFCQGLWKEVRIGLIFRERTADGTSHPYLAS